MTPWDRTSERELRRLYGSSEDVCLAARFSCSVEEIRAKALALALQKNKAAPSSPGLKMPRWTPSEVSFLCANYPASKNVTLALTLGRSARSVADKARRLGLSKGPARKIEMGRENVAMRADRRGA